MIQELNEQYVIFFSLIAEKTCDNEKINDSYKELVKVLINFCTLDNNPISIFRFLREVEIDIQLKLKNRDPVYSTIVLKLEKLIKTEIEIISFKIQNPALKEYNSHSKEPPACLKWTDKKVSLVELIYSISKSINNGEVSICKIVKCFEFIFQTELGNYYDTFDEICCRKSKPARYLNSLIENLNEAINTKLN